MGQSSLPVSSTPGTSASTITSTMSIFQTRRRHKIERLDFILAGAQKSGTTALHYFLSRHPDITMGDQQEIHFFDDEKIFSETVDYDMLHRHYPLVARSTVAGDCTPIYLYWKPHRADLEIQSADQAAHSFAKSGRSRLCSLEHATVQRPGTARFSRSGESRENSARRKPRRCNHDVIPMSIVGSMASKSSAFSNFFLVSKSRSSSPRNYRIRIARRSIRSFVFWARVR